MTPAWFVSVARTGAQVVMALIVGKLASMGVPVPEAAQNWIINVFVVALAVTAWTALVRWLETRTGNTRWAIFARLAGRLLMLGIKAQPVYHAPADIVMAPELLGKVSLRLNHVE